MAVVQGNTALASDYSTLRGEVNRWFADNYAGAISFGDGNQTCGWGGAAVADVSQGTDMLASQMNSLVDRCNIGVGIISDSTGTLSQVVAGNNVLATDYNDTETKSDSIGTNRLGVDTDLAIAGGGNSQRVGSWGSAAIDCTFRYTFSDFDEARYFFNSGGACRLTLEGFFY